MITKGTENYKKAQNLAFMFSSSNPSINYHVEWACDSIIEHLDNFAKEVATTIMNGIDKYGTPRVSSKQAWILACAVVENNLDY